MELLIQQEGNFI